MSGIGETTTFAHAGKIVATALHAKCEVQAAEINRLERERDELLAALKLVPSALYAALMLSDAERLNKQQTMDSLDAELNACRRAVSAAIARAERGE